MTDGVGYASGVGSAAGVGSPAVATGTAAGIGSASGDFRIVRDIVEPVSGRVAIKELTRAAPDYADADAAYKAWCTELGVGYTGSDYTISDGYTGTVFIDTGFPVVDGGLSTTMFLGRGTGLHFYSTGPVAQTGSWSGSDNWGTGAALFAGTRPSFRPFFILGAEIDAVYQLGTSGYKIRNMWLTSNPSRELIGFYKQHDSSTPTLYLHDVAFRLRPGFIDFYVTFYPGSLIGGAKGRIQYVIANETTNTFTSGVVLSPTFDVGTQRATTLDFGVLHPIVEETVDSTDSVPVAWNLATSVGELATTYTNNKFGWGKTISESITKTPADSISFRPGVIVSEVVRMQDVQLRQLIYSPTVSNILRLTSAVRSAYNVVTAESVTIAQVEAVVRGAIVIEQLALAGSAATSLTYTTTVAQSLRISDALRRFFGGSISEMLTSAPVAAAVAKFPMPAAESLSVAGSLAHTLIFAASANETIELDHVDALQMLYSGVIEDGVDIAIGHLSPGGDFTAWAVNTVTGGTTEYTNFNFNSFAQLGHKVIGASSAGLYELNGADDDGSAITAVLRGGYMQFGNSRLSSLEAAYLGLRGDGTFLFRLYTGDAKSYTYQVNAHSMKTTKVNVGKGIRTRYIAFELEGTDDFDLDSVEFLPVVANRRV